LLAIEGMREYGFNTDADRISYNFVGMVAEKLKGGWKLPAQSLQRIYC